MHIQVLSYKKTCECYHYKIMYVCTMYDTVYTYNHAIFVEALMTVCIFKLSGTIFDVEKLLEFSKFGCYIDFDLFGIETSHYQLWDAVDFPSDAQRIYNIKALVDAGFEDQVTLGHDIHTKHRLVSKLCNSVKSLLFHIQGLEFSTCLPGKMQVEI